MAYFWDGGWRKFESNFTQQVSFKNKEKENLLTTKCNTSPTNDKENADLNVYFSI